MKNLRNTVTLIGRLGQNPEIIKFDNGNSKATFSLATNESYKNKDGEKVESTEWHRLTIWGKRVETAEKYLKKGMEIVVEGRLTYNKWEDKEGAKHSTTEINVNSFSIISAK
jgi:single-strand DNA-binding protein